MIGKSCQPPGRGRKGIAVLIPWEEGRGRKVCNA